MIKTRIGYMSLVRIIAGVAFVSLSAPAFAQGAQSSKWFRYTPAIDKTWSIAEVSGNPNQFEIERRGKEKGAATKRIMVLYPRASSAYDIAISKILQVFESKDLDTSFTIINFNMKDADGAKAVAFAEKNKVDLIFAMGSESTAWLYDNYRNSDIPIVSVCSKDPVQLGQIKDYETGSGNNFAFTSLNVPVDVQMAYVKDLKPDLKNLTVLVDSKNISAVQTQAEPIATYARDRGIQVIWGAIDSPAQAREQLVPVIKNAVQTMRRNDPDLSKSLFWVTGSTSVFKEIRTINEHADRVPVVSVVPEIVTAGQDTAVLAIGISFESNAHLAAIYGADILAGRAKPGDLKVGLVSPPDIAISFLKVREIGLRVPFQFYETASYIYDYEGKAVRTVANRGSEDN